ncbi:imm11 family protein [Paenibacillus silvae]|uniref:imm11 family protein n=1 Tax=Paenibacillus TaxID=44249 RepID=UPI001C109C4C|nr:DUF1629 domain-containing protein [Paenibacillus barcinonensis]MBU5350728.1 hypothetical protein [Paenibacillus barcinonensis]
MIFSAVSDPLPDNIRAEVELLSSVRSLKVDYFETITRTRVVSDAFKTLLEPFKTNVQFIPAVVRYHDARPVEQTYWIAHLLEQVDGFDYERSEYGRKKIIAASVHQPPRKTVKVITRLVLDSDKIEGHHFFKLAYVSELKPIISSELYATCKKHKLKLHVTAI